MGSKSNEPNLDRLSNQKYIGTAAWTIPPNAKDGFPSEGTHLERYSQVLNCVEINTSFYREHKPDTYAKWAESVPENFRFSAKLLRYFTQEKRLRETGEKLKEVIGGMSHLGRKWGVLLIQLPPSLSFQQKDVDRFLSAVRKVYEGPIAWEPRHTSWTTDHALDLLANYEVSKVRADPEPCYVPARNRRRVEKFLYYRLHGSPEIYKSRYDKDIINRVAQKMDEANKPAWCIFDNTTFGFATENALELKDALNQ